MSLLLDIVQWEMLIAAAVFIPIVSIKERNK